MVLTLTGELYAHGLISSKLLSVETSEMSGTMTLTADFRSGSSDQYSQRSGAQPTSWVNTMPLASNMSTVSKRSSGTLSFLLPSVLYRECPSLDMQPADNII